MSPGLRELVGSERHVRKGAARTSPAEPNETIMVSIYLRCPPHAPPLHDQHYYAARRIGQRKHLSRAEFAATYGATAEDIKAVSDFATAHDLDLVATSPARRLVQVSGTARQLAAAFSVELFQYQSPQENYRAHEGPIYLPAQIANIVEGVFGLDNRRMARRTSGERRIGGGGGGGVTSTITPPDVAKAYNFPSNSAKGQTIAVLEFSGPTDFGDNGFVQSDIDGYIEHLNIRPGTNLVSTNVGQVVVHHPGNVPGGGYDFEIALDLEIIVSVAQEAKVVVYFSTMTEQGWVDAISHIVNDDANDPSVLSISWGWSELESKTELAENAFWGDFGWSQQAFNNVSTWFRAAAEIGMTVFTGSADYGSDCGEGDGMAHVVYPGSDPWVTCCGGTVINGFSPLVEDTWYEDYVAPSGQPGVNATGGGISYLVDLPYWQSNWYWALSAETGPNIPLSVNPDHHQGRGVPDIAGNAAVKSGYFLWLHGSLTTTPGGGTSAVAPLYAALVARINASLGTRVGYLNPTLYELGVAGSTVFRDINDGIGNSVPTDVGPSPGYFSGPGWDACTGWGSLDGSALLSALTPVKHITVPVSVVGSVLTPTVIIEYPWGETVTLPGDLPGPPLVIKVGGGPYRQVRG
jgi:kumamolisin